ncbi:MAG TPA: hypothetical protein VKX17_25355 [Planctomycetota bacterium]|nr:hypothetical protein [Planctomycetota bacterium]
MTNAGRAILCLTGIVLALELTGCGSPPPPPRSAKAEISDAENAVAVADALCQRGAYDQAKTQYETAMSAISKGQTFAAGSEKDRLESLRTDVHKKKLECEDLARRAEVAAANKPKTAAVPTAKSVGVDPEVEKRNAEIAKAVADAKRKKEIEADISAAAPKKKADEPEDAGEVAANRKDKAKPKAGDAASDDAAKAPTKDKNGIFPDVTDASPELQVVKLQHIGKFVVAYVQLFNKATDGRRFSVGNFFKSSDNQNLLDARQAYSFPYDRFSLKAKDLLGDQPVNPYTADSAGVDGQGVAQFVSVGEFPTEEAAARVTKLYVLVRYGDGKTVEATGPEGVAAAIDKALPKLLK